MQTMPNLSKFLKIARIPEYDEAKRRTVRRLFVCGFFPESGPDKRVRWLRLAGPFGREMEATAMQMARCRLLDLKDFARYLIRQDRLSGKRK